MKTFWKILVLIFFLSFFNNQNLYSEDCPCTADGCTFQSSSTFTLLTQYANCFALVKFSYCKNEAVTPPIYNVRIDEIVTLTSGCTPGLMEQWIRMATQKLLSDVYNIFGIPSPSSGNYTVKLTVPSCLKLENDVIVPCDIDKCCKVEYELRNIEGCPTVMNDVTEPTYCACPEITPGEVCDNSCDNIIFPKDTCLNVNIGYCDWFCETDNAGSLTGDYDSTSIVPGFVTPWLSWGLYGPNNDTLCVIINEIIYNAGISNWDDEYAMRRAIQISLWNLYIQTWGYDRNYTHYIRVTLPSCYRRESEANDIGLLPCVTDCCSILYEVGLSGDQMYIADYTSNSPLGSTCDGSYGVCDITPCDEDIFANGLIPAPKINTNYNDGIQIKGEYKTFVKPNPGKESISIYFISDKIGEYIIEIYSLNGKKISEHKLNKVNYEEFIKIQTNELNNGIYFYRIMHNNENVISNKFMIKH